MAMTQWGERTRKEVIHKDESHKLHQAFNVQTGKTVLQGNPCVLLADGTVRAYEATDVTSAIIGYAITDNVYPAYKADRQSGPVEVTLSVRGYQILNGIAKANLEAGFVKPDGTMGAEPNEIYTGYIQAETADISAGRTELVALHPADSGELVMVLVR